MSLQRVVAPMTSSASFVFRSMKPCHHLVRTFSSAQSPQMSSKRKMQTSTAYHPSSFDLQPPPPRNAGIPDTSIAGSKPEVSSGVRPPPPTGLEITLERSSEEKSNISLPEKEAQKSQPTTTSTTPTRAKPRPKLRARKAAMKLTPTAVLQLRAMLDQPSPKLIKVGVKNRGCSGLSYNLEYVDKPGVFDEAIEQDGVKVLIDSKALFSIIGSEMDWVEDKLNQRFVFSNPNISMYLLPEVVWKFTNIIPRGKMRMRRIFHGMIQTNPVTNLSSRCTL